MHVLQLWEIEDSIIFVESMVLLPNKRKETEATEPTV